MNRPFSQSEELSGYFARMFSDSFIKMIISKPHSKAAAIKKIEIIPLKDKYQLTLYAADKVFHENRSFDEVLEVCIKYMCDSFQQVNGWDGEAEYSLMISKGGKIFFKRQAKAVAPVKVRAGHDRKKNYLLEEGTVIPPLIDMGIFTLTGQVVKSKADKFKQINRLLEIIDDVIREVYFLEVNFLEVNAPEINAPLNIIDFGCGKSYLTFVIYYYFVYIKKIPVNITGLDLKADVIERCNDSAKKYGYDRLHFEVGDISKYKPHDRVDMVVSLHACDVATDYALYNAVRWEAKYIFCVPCCQHELNRQMETDSLKILTRYGIVKERVAALMTDAIRANLLDHYGYRTQLLEFIDFDSTPKNILIRAVRGDQKVRKKSHKLAEVHALMEEFALHPTLYDLLADGEELQ
ncbi:MAG: SAM-dependent methyltransferase [Lachnospiraceae bacterium]|jgi:SAM-dependent methyltransferase|nr:SAM-dependent methyltransferase [Lachnospiraceae bacterium]